MRVSVILPVLNEESFMQIALESLNDQTVPFELIVVDGGSTDRTVEIARQYTPLVFQIEHGKLNAKQFGVFEATRNIIVTVDADMQYPSTFIENITRHFSDPNVVFATCTFYVMDETSLQSLGRAITSRLGYLFLKYSPGCVQAFTKEAFFTVGGYDLTIDQLDFMSVVWEEEINFPQRMARIGKTVFDPHTHAFMFDRRSMCPHFGTESCPVEHEAVCEFCKQIAGGKRF